MARDVVPAAGRFIQRLQLAIRFLENEVLYQFALRRHRLGPDASATGLQIAGRDFRH
jgi:hypothetical protein